MALAYGICGRGRRLLALLLVLALLFLPLTARAGAEEGEYIVKYRNGDTPFDVVSAGELRRLLRQDALEWYEPDGEATLTGDISPYFGDEAWNLALVGADAAFAQGFLGQGVRIGIVDSGVNPHPALGDRLLPGRCCIPDAADETDTSDTVDHGTRVAGLIAGTGEEGYLGPAPEAELVPLKCTDGKEAKVSAVCAAIYSGIDDFGCQILNLSLGVSQEYIALREAIAYAEERGVLVVSAVGNNGDARLYYPAAYDTVIGVGAVGEDGIVYLRSNHNASLFLTAPGVNVTTTFAQGGYGTATGTSFAVPAVTAAAAVLLSARADLTPARLRELLAGSAEDRGIQGFDEYYGHGILNISGSLAALLEAPEEAGEEYCPLSAFTDLDQAAWYHDGVHYALESGLMKGVGEGQFAPAVPASRGMIVTMLWRLEGEPAPAGEASFSDVPEGTWYTEAVRWAASSGIAGGYGDGRFGPVNSITREQLVTILCRYARYLGLDTASVSAGLSAFPDGTAVSPWAAEAMGWAVGAGLISGTEGGLLSPGTDAGRAQVATVLLRFSALDPGHTEDEMERGG